MPNKSLEDLLALAGGARVYDLGVDLYPGVPHFPTHPPFVFGLTKRHGEFATELPDGRVASSSADAIATGTHVGTHIDGLGHFSCNGMLFGGAPTSGQSYEKGLPVHGLETVAPISRRGVLLDVARLEGVPSLPKDFSIGPNHLEEACRRQKTEIRAGDVVLLRTGWAQYWPDPSMYVTGGKGNAPTGPGPEIDAARWLSAQGIFATGSDTLAYERVPSAMPVHVHLLVERGIHLIEVLDLERIAADGIFEFLFVALPLKIRGATGSPVRPIALAV